MDEKTQKEILIGKCNVEGLKSGAFGEILKEENKNYIPDPAIIALLLPKIENISIEIVLGTWCGDSKEQVPRFIKVLDDLKYKIKKVEFVCVDRNFTADDFDKVKMNILKVPTFIIYSGNNEIGRIVETPAQTLEKDLLDILK